MRDFFLHLFGTTDGSIEITLFSFWHFLYLFLIIGGTIGSAFLLKDRSKETQTKVLNALSVTVVALYIADFFIMPLSESSNHIATDKLPFHICTLTGVFSATGLLIIVSVALEFNQALESQIMMKNYKGFLK